MDDWAKWKKCFSVWSCSSTVSFLFIFRLFIERERENSAGCCATPALFVDVTRGYHLLTYLLQRVVISLRQI